jgi:hypothetical protein
MWEYPTAPTRTAMTFITAFLFVCAGTAPVPADPAKPADIYAPDNLVAWCIVPFDAKKRSPAQRVEMLQSLGFNKYAYDWRAEHLP